MSESHFSVPAIVQFIFNTKQVVQQVLVMMTDEPLFIYCMYLFKWWLTQLSLLYLWE